MRLVLTRLKMLISDINHMKIRTSSQAQLFGDLLGILKEYQEKIEYLIEFYSKE